jgi:hypothetical protein
VTVKESVRSVAAFSVHNLVGEDYPTGMDVIFCRNVLLYFCEAAAAAVFPRFEESLVPGGLLFLGTFDQVPRKSDGFSEERLGSVRYFRRGVRAAPERPAPRRLTTRAAARMAKDASPPQEDSRLRYCDAMALSRGLCREGASLEALSVLASLDKDFPLEVEPQVLTALIADEAGLIEPSLSAARRAHFLAPEEPICQFLLGACLDRVGEARQAELHLRRARSALDKVQDRNLPLPYGEGMTAFSLRRMIDARISDDT